MTAGVTARVDRAHGQERTDTERVRPHSPARTAASTLVTEILEALAGGGHGYDVVCAAFAHSFDADAAAVIRLDLHTGRQLWTCWPHTIDIARVKVVAEHLPQAFPLLVRDLAVRSDHTQPPSRLSASGRNATWRTTLVELLAQEVLACRDVAWLPCGRRGDEVRVVLLARADEFTAGEVDVLRLVQRPMMALTTVLARLAAQATPPHDRSPTVTAGRIIDTAALTPREVEVLCLLAEGLLARTIAARMQVSPRTVHKHLASVYRKLDVHDRLVAVDRARDAGIIPVTSLSAR